MRALETVVVFAVGVEVGKAPVAVEGVPSASFLPDFGEANPARKGDLRERNRSFALFACVTCEIETLLDDCGAVGGTYGLG